MSGTIAAFTERELIERIRVRAAHAAPDVHLGIGDDAAVIEPERGMVQVITTDALVECVHFRRDWTAPAAIGHKALAVNLSDLAAMGATPRAALLSLALPADFPIADFDALVGGFATLAGESRVALIGGNLTRSPGPLVVDVTAIGYARRRRVLRRDTARPGDDLCVTGAPGQAAAGLAMLAAGVPRAHLTPAAEACVARYERPDARWPIASTVARSGGAAAAMDLSDGLADAARQMAEASGIGVVIDAAAVPIAQGVTDWTAEHGDRTALDMTLAGGDDYELVFAVAPRRRRRFRAAVHRHAGVPVTSVGRFVKAPGAWIERDGQRRPLPAGFSHFRG
jgi:thiamine-monophosphate kinase